MQIERRRRIQARRKVLIVLWVAVAAAMSVILCSMCVLTNLFEVRIPKLPDLPVFTTKQEPQIIRTVTEGDDALELLWSRPRVRGTQSMNPSRVITAENGVLCYIRPPDQSVFHQVVAIDAQDGETVLWSTRAPNPSVIYATSSALYVGGFGNGVVASHDLRTGKRLWSKWFPLERTIIHLKVVDALVYVRTAGSGRFLLQADTGKRVVNWDSVPSFRTEYFQDVTLTEDTEFRTDFYGAISARDRPSGQVLWQTTPLSNAAVIDSAVYLIARERDKVKLLGLEPRSGEIMGSVTFEPSVSAEVIESLPGSLPAVAVDKELGIVYVLFRDTEQLFAFRIVGYEGE